MSWRIKVNGITYPAEIKEISEELNGNEYAKFTFQNDFKTRSIMSSNQNVSISFFNRIIYRGVLVGGDYTQQNLTAKVYNPTFYKMNKKTHTHTWTGSNGEFVLSGIAYDASVDYGLTPSGDTIKVFYDFTNSLQAARYLAEATDNDIWSSGYNQINIGTRGQDRGKLKNVTISRRGTDRYKTRNRYRIRGQDASGIRIYGLAGIDAGGVVITGVARIGDMVGDDEKVDTDKKARSATELDAMAKYRLDLIIKDTDSMQVKVPINDGYKLLPGDSVTIDDTELNLSGSYRIWKTNKKESVVTLELDKPANMVQKEIMNAKKLDDLGIYPIVASQAAPIAPSSISTNMIQDDAITTTKIDDYSITTPKLTANEIIGKWFATTVNVGAVNPGVKFNIDGIEGWGGGALQFSLSASDGKVRAAGGRVILDVNGVSIYGKENSYYDDSNVLTGFIKGSGNVPGVYGFPALVVTNNTAGNKAIYVGDEDASKVFTLYDPASSYFWASANASMLLEAPDFDIAARDSFVIDSIAGYINLNTTSLQVRGSTGNSAEFTVDGVTLTFTRGLLTNVA
jgi:hypothetical protein